MEKSLYDLFLKLEFNKSYKVISEKKLVDEFIEMSRGKEEIFLGKVENKNHYPFLGVVYHQNVSDPVTNILKYIYCGISSATTYDKLIKRPMEDWYNFSKSYAGKKVNEIREKIGEGEYTCDTEITLIVYGDTKEDVQKALNIYEVNYISEIPGEMKLNTTRGGGNYIRGKKKLSEIKENPHYILSEEDEKNDTSFWAIRSTVLKNYVHFFKYYSKSCIDPWDFSKYFIEIKYSQLTDYGKMLVEKRIPGNHKDDDGNIHEYFIVSEEQKDELFKINDILNESDYFNDRKVPCVKIVSTKDGYIDFEKSKGYSSITECDVKERNFSYNNTRCCVNNSYDGYFRFRDFIKRYLAVQFNL